MEKRVLVTIALSMAILAGWFTLQAKYFPPPQPPARPEAPVAAQPEAGGTPGAPPPAGTAAPEKAAAKPAEKPREQLTHVERPHYYRAVFSSWGASPRSFVLLHPQYKREEKGHELPIDMVQPQAGEPPFAVSFRTSGEPAERSDFELPPDAAWTLLAETEQAITYGIDVGPVHIEKRWELPASGYRMDLRVTIENRGPKPLSEHLIVGLAGWQDPNVKPGGLLSFGRRYDLTEGACDIGGKLKRLPLEEAQKKPPAEAGDVKWIGTGEPFFLRAVAFPPSTEGRACAIAAEPDGRIFVRAIFPSVLVAPGQKIEHTMAGFMGPKLLTDLDAVRVGGVDSKLGDAVDYTFEFVARPMLWVLRKIQSLVGNWGVAIMLITLLLKLATFYPTQKSMQSAKQMAKLKPEIDRLKARYGNDKQAFSQAQMALFKERGINPLGGCLPMLLQMPIYIAFYSMLSNAVELYRASFIGPIRDMTAPFWPMAAVTGALMFVQQKMSPQSTDPQQRMMMYMMPVMVTSFTLFLPSGLTLYILTNTLLTMVQQWLLNRGDPKPAAPAGKPARA